MPCKLFASGFRPTFLAAGLAAALLIPAWVAVAVFGAPLASAWPPTLWHAHEMVFGFVAPAIAGFLLTAVPNWTGGRVFSGAPLAALVTLWLLARLMIASSLHWPPSWVGAADVAFLPLLAVLIAPPLWRASRRNTPLLAVLALLAACNAVFHGSLARHDPVTAQRAVLLAIDVALLLVTVIGGRILPAFTANALRAGGDPPALRTWRGSTPAAIAAMVAVALVDLWRPESGAAAAVAALAAAVQAARLWQWRSERTLGQPILWVLHAAYAWLPIGLALKAAALWWGPAWSAFWLHALTIGVLATMILGVMTRAALGHTGRRLEADARIVAAYGLLLGAAGLRVFGLAVLRLGYPSVIVLSACCWTAAFGLFTVVYAPMLWRSRVDGKAG